MSGHRQSARDKGRKSLTEARHWFLDLDGTVYLGGEVLPGAHALIRHFESRGTGYTFLTNNSSRGPIEYMAKLRALGFSVGSSHLFTSGQATASYLGRELPGARAYVVGTPALAAELAAAGLVVTEDDADLVVLGFDPHLSFARVTKACALLRAGARYVATHPDVNCPVPGGYLPDAGAVAALIEAATGRRPEKTIGKPNSDFISEAATRAGVEVGDCAMVGDRLETDVAMAIDVGIPGVLVLTGATSLDDDRLAQAPWRGRVEVFGGLDALLESLGAG